MKRNTTHSGRNFWKEHRTDTIFAAVAAAFLVLMISLLIYYTGLRNQNQAKPEEYGIAMQEMNDIKMKKNELESKISAITREIEELNKKISALGGK